MGLALEIREKPWSPLIIERMVESDLEISGINPSPGSSNRIPIAQGGTNFLGHQAPATCGCRLAKTRKLHIGAESLSVTPIPLRDHALYSSANAPISEN